MNLSDVSKTYVLHQNDESQLNEMLRLGWRIVQLRVHRIAWDNVSPAFRDETSYLLGATADLPITEELRQKHESYAKFEKNE